MILINFDDLVKGFKALGIKKGDILLVHSSFKSFGGVEGGPETVINALLHVLGIEGTLLFPTFTFQFCDDFNSNGEGYFDVDQTPSEMGILTEIFRKMPGVKRSINPIYSVAVYGKFADELSSVSDKSVFGKESIFGKLYQKNGKIMIIGLSYDHSWTFSHYIEQKEGVDYRYPKDFSGWIVTGGKSHWDTFTMLVRDIEKGVVTHVEPMGEVLERRGVVKVGKIGESIVKVMKTQDAYKITSQEMKKNPMLMYRIETASDT